MEQGNTKLLGDDHHHQHRSSTNHHNHQDGTLKASIFGFNDGLCTNVNVVIGIYVALVQLMSRSSEAHVATLQLHSTILRMGLCGLFAGASSMAAGEWLSAYAERLANRHELAKERRHHETISDDERTDLCKLLQESGLEETLASTVADAVNAMPIDQRVAFHAKYELGIDEVDVSITHTLLNAVHMWIAFAVGALVPILPWVHTPTSFATPADAKHDAFVRFVATIVASLVAIVFCVGLQNVQIYRSCHLKSIMCMLCWQLLVTVIAVGISSLLNFYVTGSTHA